MSATAMNENFGKLGEAIDSLVGSVTQLQNKNPGYPKSLNVSATYASPKLVFKAASAGILYARPVGSGNSYLGVALTVGDGVSNADPPVVQCGGTACSSFASRAFEASSANVLVPANAYVMVDAIYSSEVPATINFMWQPMDAAKGEPPTQTYPAN